VISRKLAEQEVESLGVSHSLVLFVNCKRRLAISARRLLYFLQFISININLFHLFQVK
jgi:hypothetical protein